MNDLNECKYEITSITETIVKIGKIKTNSIDLSELNIGVYFIKIFEIQSSRINIAQIMNIQNVTTKETSELKIKSRK